jgi:CubicO group peptidase (beta-lactamase class C family)
MASLLNAATEIFIRRPRELFVALACFSLVACNGGGEIVDRSKQEIRQKLLQKSADDTVQNGVVAAAFIYRDGNDEARAIAGRRSLTMQEAAQRDDWTRIGSISKSFTSVMAGALVERSIIGWNTTLAEALPTLAPGMREAYRTVTLEQLLNHMGGVMSFVDNIEDADLFLDSLASATEPLPTNFVGRQTYFAKWLLSQPLRPGITPGKDFYYSNAGYVLASMMMEARSGKSFSTLFEELIATPMSQTVGLAVPSALLANTLKGHVGQKGALAPAVPRPVEVAVWEAVLQQPSGGVYATAQGLSTWLAWHQEALNTSAALLKLPTGYIQRLKSAAPQGYALGWEIGDNNGQPIFVHSGIVEGFTCIVSIARNGASGSVAYANVEASEANSGWVLSELISGLRAITTGWK